MYIFNSGVVVEEVPLKYLNELPGVFSLSLKTHNDYNLSTTIISHDRKSVGMLEREQSLCIYDSLKL